LNRTYPDSEDSAFSPIHVASVTTFLNRHDFF
jgi:hypothetical protein